MPAALVYSIPERVKRGLDRPDVVPPRFLQKAALNQTFDHTAWRYRVRHAKYILRLFGSLFWFI
jgi:hypothetical protein